MIKLVISNQRGGVGKTTTVVTLARCFAERGLKVLLLDTDSQGSVTAVLNLKPEPGCNLHWLADQESALCGMCHAGASANRRRLQRPQHHGSGGHAHRPEFPRVRPAEGLQGHDEQYDVILIDVAPSVTLFQTCAMIYARKVLVPVDMDMLSFQGALASLETTSFPPPVGAERLRISVSWGFSQPRWIAAWP